MFVGGLPFATTQTELEELFSEVGEIGDVFIPMDRESGRPRGFAFVEYADAAHATAAIAKFDGYDLGGRALRVNEAEAKPQRAPRSFNDDGGGGGGGGRGGYNAPPKRSKPKGSRKNARARKRGF